jgi:predicted nucleic acid-binding protein
VLGLATTAPERLPIEAAISALTLAELAAGPHATEDPLERARRQDNLQRIEAAFQPIPFGPEAARAYGRIFAAVTVSGRTPRGARAVDLLIAATAAAEGIPLYTGNADDVAGLEGLVEVIAL